MAINSNHLMGFAMGFGAAAAGFYLYKKNQPLIDAWLKEQGINIPGSTGKEPSTMSLEELVTEKERLEDVIAEHEFSAEAEPSKA